MSHSILLETYRYDMELGEDIYEQKKKKVNERVVNGLDWVNFLCICVTIIACMKNAARQKK